jgi:hypothetical protein
MDLRLYSRVLWRFRYIVAIGFLLACALSFLSVARVSFVGSSPKISYRQPETWKATVLMLLTQKGFPYGYTILPTNPAQIPGSTGTPTLVPSLASPGTFTALAMYYAPFAQSDAFQTMLRHQTNIKGIVQAQALIDPTHQTQTILPYIDLFAYANSEAKAVKLANLGSGVFSQYVVGLQNANKIPTAKRVETQVVSSAQHAVIFSGRKKTTPIAVFLTVMLAAIGLSFVLENLRPRIHKVAPVENEADQAVTARRPA